MPRDFEYDAELQQLRTSGLLEAFDFVHTDWITTSQHESSLELDRDRRKELHDLKSAAAFSALQRARSGGSTRTTLAPVKLPLLVDSTAGGDYDPASFCPCKKGLLVVLRRSYVAAFPHMRVCAGLVGSLVKPVEPGVWAVRFSGFNGGDHRVPVGEGGVFSLREAKYLRPLAPPNGRKVTCAGNSRRLEEGTPVGDCRAAARARAMKETGCPSLTAPMYVYRGRVWDRPPPPHTSLAEGAASAGHSGDSAVHTGDSAGDTVAEIEEKSAFGNERASQLRGPDPSAQAGAQTLAEASPLQSGAAGSQGGGGEAGSGGGTLRARTAVGPEDEKAVPALEGLVVEGLVVDGQCWLHKGRMYECRCGASVMVAPHAARTAPYLRGLYLPRNGGGGAERLVGVLLHRGFNWGEWWVRFPGLPPACMPVGANGLFWLQYAAPHLVALDRRQANLVSSSKPIFRPSRLTSARVSDHGQWLRAMH